MYHQVTTRNISFECLVTTWKSFTELPNTTIIFLFFKFEATVFGTRHKLEPLPLEKKSMWRREMDCLLSVCDYILEFYPSSQTLPDGTTVEVRKKKLNS